MDTIKIGADEYEIPGAVWTYVLWLQRNLEAKSRKLESLQKGMSKQKLVGVICEQRQSINDFKEQVAALESDNRGLRILVDDVVLELYDQEDKT